MIISVINRTQDIADEKIHAALRAINRQIEFDFKPYWSLGATLRLEGKSGKRPMEDKSGKTPMKDKSGKTPGRETLSDMRGDAILYLWDGEDVDDALGYHERNHRGIPFSFVFSKLAEELGESWTVTLS